MPRHYTPKVDCVCQQCGTIFTATPSRVASGRGRYCSQDCYYSAGRVERTCEQCGKAFLGTVSNVAIGKDRFCSKTCFDVYQTHQLDRVCEVCGKTFTVTPSRARAGKEKHCSYACRDALKARRHMSSEGYVMILVAPGTDKYAPEHRLVAEKHLGRPLLPDEDVHHLGAKDDNRWEMLRVMSHAEHAALHHAQRRQRWSRNYDCCIRCGKTTSKHQSRGLCVACDHRARRSRL